VALAVADKAADSPVPVHHGVAWVRAVHGDGDLARLVRDADPAPRWQVRCDQCQNLHEPGDPCLYWLDSQ
jgi:hypothetical protein